MKNLRFYLLFSIFINVILIGKIYAFNDNYVISVKDYGAIGDGVTNDLDAINEAINACDINKDCTVLFPNGNYLINDSVIIGKSNIRLLGEDNSNIFFPENINLEENGNRIVGVIVVKTIDQDVSNIVVENLEINANADDAHYGKESSLGRGITFVRQGKYPETKNYYEMSNVKIKNCTVKNSYSYGIAVVGGEQLKEGYSSDYVSNILNTSADDFDYRMYYNYYNIDNIVIENTKVSNSRIGVRLNRVYNLSFKNNEVSNSRYENVTLQVNNGIVSDNIVYKHNGGCGNICIDKSENVKIINNNIDEVNSTTNNVYRTGICHNSEAGPSYNIYIENNTINNASRGIWLKDHRLRSNSGLKQVAGSRPGSGFIIKDNIINNSLITDIRIDELLDSKVIDGEFVGKSYLYNKYNNTVNLEVEDSYSGDIVGTNIKIEDNKNLVLVNPSKIIISKMDNDGNYIVGDKLQVVDNKGNIYYNIISGNKDVEVDLLLGDYILKDLTTNQEISFKVENDGGIEKKIVIKVIKEDNQEEVVEAENNEKQAVEEENKIEDNNTQKDVIDELRNNNEQSIVDVPKTLSVVSKVLIIFSISAIVVGMCIYVYSINKNK